MKIRGLLVFVLMAAIACIPAFAQGTPASQQLFQAGPVARNVSPTSATLWWATKSPTNSTVKYGTDPYNQQTAQGAANATEHSVQLQGLQPGQKYFFQIVDNNGSSMFSSVFFTPPENQAANAIRITNGPNIEAITDHDAEIAWSTNQPSSTTVKYGTSPSDLNQTAQAPWGGTTHRVRLQNLQPNTTYWFAVMSAQGLGTGSGANTATFSFQTTAPGQKASFQWPH